jgi:hypothetical protein
VDLQSCVCEDLLDRRRFWDGRIGLQLNAANLAVLEANLRPVARTAQHGQLGAAFNGSTTKRIVAGASATCHEIDAGAGTCRGGLPATPPRVNPLVLADYRTEHRRG